MSELYAIVAYDEIYGGFYGMKESEVIEVESLEEAEEYAIEMSYNVIRSYREIEERFYESAIEEELKPDTEAWDNYIEELTKEDVAYEIYKVKETNESLEFLNDEFYNDEEDFIKNYCEEILI